MRPDANRAASNASGRASQRPAALHAALSLLDGMSPGGGSQNRSLRYKRLERPAHRVSGRETERKVFLLLMKPILKTAELNFSKGKCVAIRLHI